MSTAAQVLAETTPRIARLAALPTVAAAALVTTAVSLPVLCPFRVGTGHACPGCGLTRAVGALFRGDLSLSWRYHPLAIVMLLQLTIASVALARRPELAVGDFLTRHVRLVYANVVALVVVWVLRWRLDLLDLVVSGSS